MYGRVVADGQHIAALSGELFSRDSEAWADYFS
jgi:hypothetical protein